MYLTTIIPSHTVATLIMYSIDSVLNHLGLEKYRILEDLIYFTVIIFASFFIGVVIRRGILLILKKIAKVHDTDFTRELLRQKTITKVTRIITPLVFIGLMPFAFNSSAIIHTIVVRCADIYFVFSVGYAITAILVFIFTRFNVKENTKGLPLKGILNVVIGITWGIVIIVSISVLVQKSPATLLTGMTAFAAVLMLIFKDTILGFVAGIQMSQNDMVHVGDWIVVPSTLANGTVEDVSLTTVKVRNFDNTLVTVPPYSLVQGSFQNWRGMQATGVRRVSQNIYINPDKVVAPTPELMASLSSKYPGVAKFVDALKAKGTTVAWDKGNAPLNGTIETNLGLFRAYIIDYLLHNEMVDKTRDLFASIQTMSAEGVPLQLYFFAVTTQWESYEAVRSAIMEHALLTAPDFGLEILSADHLNVDTNTKG